jgi:hypothetical protein
MRLAARLALLALAPVVQAAQAQTMMTADEFDAWSLGKTLDFANSSGVFGSEEYLPGRQVRWAGMDGQCMHGHWFGGDQMICFAYEQDSRLHCWTLWREGDSVTARSVHDLPDDPPRHVAEAQSPLVCQGPDVGV